MKAFSIRRGLLCLFLLVCYQKVFRCLCETFAATTQETSVSTPPDNTSSDSTTGHSVSVTLNPLSAETTSRSEPFTSVETPTVTFSPVTTSSPSTLNKYIVSNSSGAFCIVMIADIIFHIKYNATEENNVLKTTNVTIPANYTTSGDCNYKDDAQLITIKFFNETWSLSITIQKDSEINTSALKESVIIPYSWKEFTLTYIVTEDLFPGVLPAYTGESVKETVWYYSGIFHTYGQSYHCNGTTTVNVSNFVQIDVSQLQYRAFGVTHDDNFSDKGITDCVKTPKPNRDVSETPAIIIGAVCGGLVVIILIVYILFRRHQHNNYELM